MTPVGSENGAVRWNGVFNKYRILRKNDALERNDAQHNAATALEPNQRRAKPNGPSALHTFDTCVRYFQALPRNNN